MYQKAEIYSEGSQQVISVNTATDNDRAIVSDGTAVTEFSITGNARYSEEIIQGVSSVYNLEKLRALTGKSQDYLNEGREQINALWHGIHALNIHTEMFTVLLLIAMGSTLEEIRESFERPHEFEGGGISHLAPDTNGSFRKQCS